MSAKRVLIMLSDTHGHTAAATATPAVRLCVIQAICEPHRERHSSKIMENEPN